MNQVRAGAILSYIGIAVNNIVGLLYTPFMLRMMGQNEYGLYSLVSSVVAYLTVLDLGFNNAIVRYTAKYRAEGKVEEQSRLFGMFLTLYSGIGLLSIVIGALLYFNVDNLFDATMTPDDLRKIRIMMVLLILNLAFTFPMSVWGGIINANERFVFLKSINIARAILNPLVMIVMLLYGYRAIGMVVITTLFNVATLTLNYIYCKKTLHIKITYGYFQWSLLKEVTAYSIWIFMSAIVDRLYWGSGQFILGIYRSAVEIAVFAVAIQIQSLYTSFSYAISGVLLPKIVKLVSDGASNKEISDFFIRISRVQFYPVSLILFGFILFGERFIELWAGRGYEGAYFIAICFMAPQLFTTMQQTAYSILQAQNRVKFRSLVLLGSSILAIGIAVPVSRQFGGTGVAICIAGGLIIGNLMILNIYYEKKLGLNLKQFWIESIKMSIYPLTISFLFYIVMRMIASESLLVYGIYIVSFVVLYISGMIMLNFNNYEKQLFFGFIRRYYIK